MTFHEGLPHRPTPDVLATIDWLFAAGFELVEQVGPEGMSCQALRFVGPSGTEVLMTTDRAQWMVDVRAGAWRKGYDLDVLAAAVTGVRDWHPPTPGPPVRQIPDGVVWREVMPAVVALVEQDDDPRPLLDELRRVRSQAVFPNAATRRRLLRDRPHDGGRLGEVAIRITEGEE